MKVAKPKCLKDLMETHCTQKQYTANHIKNFSGPRIGVLLFFKNLIQDLYYQFISFPVQNPIQS